MSALIFTIGLSDLHFFSKIGVFEHERTVGNEFYVSLEVKFSREEGINESLSDTISYVKLYDIVNDVMKKEYHLLETVCSEIISSIKTQLSGIESGKIRITKLTPPIPGISGSAFVEVIF